MKPMEQLERLAADLQCESRRQEPMQLHTSFKIGGPAELFVTVTNRRALCALIQAAQEQEVPWRVIGKGSNLLVEDTGIRGLVLQLDGEFAQIQPVGETQIECGAAVSLASVCSFAQKRGLSGLEFAWGIPGSAGGAAFMNAGAYGSEMKNVLLSCTHWNPGGQWETLPAEELDLSYRHSVYHTRRAVIASLLLQLTPDDPQAIRARMEDFMQRRRDKQPLEYPSAGSVFKRPPGQFAGALIEQCGLKGARCGGAMVSEKHAGFIINAGGATCRNVLALIAQIQETVRAQTGVSLECEIRAIGS